MDDWHQLSQPIRCIQPGRYSFALQILRIHFVYKDKGFLLVY